MKKQEIREGATYGATFRNQRKRKMETVTRKVLKIGNASEVGASYLYPDALDWVVFAAYEEDRFGKVTRSACTLKRMASWAEKEVTAPEGAKETA